jgi:hypothetical protein
VTRSKGIEQTAYYPRLNLLLSRPPFDGMPPGFEQIGDLWEDLCRWLDDDPSGARGTSTAATHYLVRHIGWPISQCLLREGGREGLTELLSVDIRARTRGHRSLGGATVFETATKRPNA